MSLFQVLNYESGTIHYAKARNEEAAKTMDPEDVTPEVWWWWHTLCGRDLIAHAQEDFPVDCARCVKAYAAGERKAAELIGRFG